MVKSGIEVFQDLTLASEKGNAARIRASLISHQTREWTHDADKENALRQHVGDKEGIIQFRYNGTELPKAALTLWLREEGYTVTNIVPTEVSQLSVSQYNSLLQNFVTKIAQPAQSEFGFSIRLTDPVRNLSSWISNDAAEALRAFSLNANKGTTNSHPSDAKRWEHFVSLVYLGNFSFGTDILMQWLIEIDGWDEESAYKLAIDYEKGLSLLYTYDHLTKE